MLQARILHTLTMTQNSLSRNYLARVRSTYAVLVEIGILQDQSYDSKQLPDGYDEVFIKNDADNDTSDGYTITGYAKDEDVYFSKVGGFTGLSILSGPFKLVNYSKTRWPELVGCNKYYAKQKIVYDGILEVDIVYEGDVITEDFRTNRVRVWVKQDTNKVYEVPVVA